MYACDDFTWTDTFPADRVIVEVGYFRKKIRRVTLWSYFEKCMIECDEKRLKAKMKYMTDQQVTERMAFRT